MKLKIEENKENEYNKRKMQIKKSELLDDNKIIINEKYVRSVRKDVNNDMRYFKLFGRIVYLRELIN